MDHSSWGVVEALVYPGKGTALPLPPALPLKPLELAYTALVAEAAILLMGPWEGTKCAFLSPGLPAHHGAVSPQGTICSLS